MVVFLPESISLTNEHVKDFYFKLLAIDKADLFEEVLSLFVDQDAMDQFFTILNNVNLEVRKKK